jgi:flagellin
MANGIVPIGNDQTLFSLAQTLAAQRENIARLASGRQIVSAADNPSGLAIATGLQLQVAAFAAATQNVQEAFNATNVAQGALATTADILTRLRGLAVQAVNDFLNPQQRQALQAEANQLVQQANTVAQTATFNGVPLLNGTFAGPQAGQPAQAIVTANVPLANGGNLVTQVTAANANFQNPNGQAQGFGGNATVNGTIQIQIVNTGNGPAAQVTVTNNVTGQVVQAPAFVPPGGTVTGFENVNVQLGNFTLADVGQTATIQINQAIPPNTQNSALQVQSGAAEGNVTGLAFGNATAQQLQIANLNLSTSANATNAIGQIDEALRQLGTIQANLGAQQAQLEQQATNNQIAGLNLQTAESNIADTNVGRTVTETTLQQLRQQIQTALIAQNNVNAAGVLTLFRL